MILVCFNNLGTDFLTIGKHYKPLRYDGTFTVVINDDDNEKSYFSARFVQITIFRKEKIKKIIKK